MAPLDLTAEAPSTPAWRHLARRAEAHPVIVGSLAALALGALLLGRRSFTADEAYGVVAARGSFGDAVGETLRTDPASSGYVALLQPILRLGDDEWLTRAPSVAAAVAAAALAALLASMLAGKLAALVAGIALATNAGVVAVAQQARPLTIAMAAMLLATVLFVRAFRSGGIAWWAGYALAAAILPLTHPVAVSALVAQGVALAFARGGRRPSYAIGAFAFAAVESILLVTAVAVDRWPTRGASSLDGEELARAVADAAGRNPLLVALAVCGVVLAAMGRVPGIDATETVLVGGLCVAPLVLLLGSALLVPVHAAPALVACAPGLAVACGIATAALPTRWAAPVGAGALVVAVAWVVVHYTETQAADWRTASAAVASSIAPGETVVVTDDRGRFALAAYEPGLRPVSRPRGSAVWLLVTGSPNDATEEARTIVPTPRFALLSQSAHGDALTLQRWVRP